MKKFNKFQKSLIAVGLLFAASCTYDFPAADPETLPSPGQADFTKFIAIGNSLTAGVADNTLYDRSQQNSFPAILAKQFASVGGGDFIQPDVNSPFGCFNPLEGCTLGRLRLVVINGTTTIQPSPEGSPNGLAPFADKANLQNFGVPGMSIGLAQTPALGTLGNQFYNPYYARIASEPGTSTALGDFITELKDGTTFFSFWLGNIDVLGYATGGASNPALLTSEGAFDAAYNGAIDAIMAENTTAKGVIANIPDVTSIPYFRTVPYNAVPVTSQLQADQLNAGYADYNNGLLAAEGGTLIDEEERIQRTINFTLGANSVIIYDENLTDLSGLGLPSIREATAQDLVILPAASFIGTTVGGDPTQINGVTVPLADNWVLLPEEITEIQERTAAFNAIIADAVDAYNTRLALVDANAVLGQLAAAGAAGITVNGIALTASFQPPYGAFSLDGVHPNSRGYAYVANKFIEAINAKWSARIPYVNPNDYPGNDLPVPVQ